MTTLSLSHPKTVPKDQNEELIEINPTGEVEEAQPVELRQALLSLLK